MKLAFRRRRVRIRDEESGEFFVAKIPFDPAAKDDQDAWRRHIRKIARLTPDQISALFSTRLGEMLCGSIVREHSPMDNYPRTPDGYLRYLREQWPELTKRGRR